jgi:hypothetical protein
MGRPHLLRSKSFIKLANQIFVKSIGLLKGEEMRIMEISTMVDFEIIDLFEERVVYVGLMGRTRGRKTKEPISLEKDGIKLKGNGKKKHHPSRPK